MSEVKYAVQYVKKCRGGRFFNGVSFFMQVFFLLIALEVTWLSVLVSPDMPVVLNYAYKKRTVPDRSMDELVKQAYRLKKDRR